MFKKYSALLLLLLSMQASFVGMASAVVYYDQPETALDPVIFDDDIDFWAELDADGNVYMDWSIFDRANEPFDYYKVVRSSTNTNPVYPEDGYIFYSDDFKEVEYIDKDVPFGTFYYRVCQLAGTKIYCSSEVQKIEKKRPLLTITEAAELEYKPTNNLLLPIKPIDSNVDDAANGSDAELSANPADQTDSDAKVIELTDENKEKIINAIDKKIDAATGTDKSNTGFKIQNFLSDYWVEFLALIVSLVGLALAITGFTVAGSRKKKSVSRFMHEIDDTFASFKWKSKRCEAELYRLEDVIEDQLKDGKIDDGTYHLLVNRIKKYLDEIKDIDKLPEHLKGDDK